ncbi:MAG: hypothetical protein WCZ90_17490, partial [Melioribacteraceae bacterium]
MLEFIITLYGILGSTASLHPFLEKLKSKISRLAVHEQTIIDSYKKAINDITGEDATQFHLKGEVAIISDAFNFFEKNDFKASEASVIKFFANKNIDFKTLTERFKYYLAEAGNLQLLTYLVVDLIDKIKESEREEERIEKYLFRIVNEKYWRVVQESSDQENLFDYYTKTNSRIERIQQVVLNGLNIPNPKIEKVFSTNLNEAVANNIALIKILSRGGEGKSTFIHHISRKYYREYQIVFIERLELNTLTRLEKRIKETENKLPIIFVIDNPAIHSEKLARYIPGLIASFQKYKQIYVLAEREIRYANIPNLKEFESLFNNVSQIDYRANNLREEIFEKLFSCLERQNSFTIETKNAARNIYLEIDEEIKRKSISECTYSVLKYLRNTTGFKFRFDWEDWEDYSEQKNPNLKRLYLVLATFYQFGYSLNMDFCTEFMNSVNSMDIIDALGESVNLPIYMRGDHLFLRHETIAEWYFEEVDQGIEKNRKNSEILFKEFLAKIESNFSKDLFIWINKNKDFRRSYLSKYIKEEMRVEVLDYYIKAHPKELKCRTELSKIYQQQKKWKEAEEILLESLRIDHEQLHPRTELSK